MGRLLLDAFTEAILTLVAFFFLFLGWIIRWTLATVFFLAVMAAAGYYVFAHAIEGGSYVRVPDITNRPITEASLLLAEKGLETGKQTQVSDESVPKYYIIAQRPGSGKVVRTGRKIFLTVSTGAENVVPPDLVGKTLQQADEEIRRTSFALGNVSRIVHNSPRDTVIAQDPAADQRASSNARINLLVSEGQRPVNAFLMPDLFHKPVQEVEQILAPFGVKLKPNRVELPDQPFDVILDQQPMAGSLIQPGDLVTYTVCPSGGVALPDAQRRVPEIAYVIPNSWYEREVRVDIVDRNGVRTTIFPTENDLIDGLPPTFAGGNTIVVPSFSFIDKAMVEIYLDRKLAKSYYFEGDAEPIVTPP